MTCSNVCELGTPEVLEWRGVERRSIGSDYNQCFGRDVLIIELLLLLLLLLEGG